MKNLAIVTSCSGYGKYLREWAESIIALERKPGEVVIVTHGCDQEEGDAASGRLLEAGIQCTRVHAPEKMDFGSARNLAVSESSSEWVMHLDADDMLMPHALDDVSALAPSADVVALGYERCGDLSAGPRNRTRVYSGTTGLQALEAKAPCSGVSPFRRTLWEQSPYRTDMRGAWDTALWIGFARLGARFRATRRPCFWYRQHADSIFNKRRLNVDWTHALTVAQLQSLRRNDEGVAVIVPRDTGEKSDRAAIWARLREHYAQQHPEWEVIEGRCHSTNWCKGEAVADALKRCRRQVLVIADADCLVSQDALVASVAAVQSGAPWAVPHDRVLRMSREFTAQALSAPAGAVSGMAAITLARPEYTGYAGGGIFVVSRAVYDAAGGIPSSFRGWGAEDQAFAVILDCLAGPHIRGAANLYHFWHNPHPSKRTPGNNNKRLQQIRSAAKNGQAALLEVLRTLPETCRPWRERYRERELARRNQKLVIKTAARATGKLRLRRGPQA